MSYVLGRKSLAELEGVEPRLVSVVKMAIRLTEQDFSVHDGIRTLKEQEEYVRRGVSKTMNSKHLAQPDGFGHAVDLVPYINGQLRWEWKPIYILMEAVKQSAIDHDVKLRWGGVWDRTLNDLGDLEHEVESYVARRRAAGKRAFIDGPHVELL